MKNHMYHKRSLRAYNPNPKWPKGYFKVLEKLQIP